MISPDTFCCLTMIFNQGGLTREFLTDVWKQLDQLDIFVITGDSLVPEGDELLKGKDSEMTLLPKNDESMTDKDSGTTRAYCIAVGRILLYCLVQKIPIAAHVLVSSPAIFAVSSRTEILSQRSIYY